MDFLAAGSVMGINGQVVVVPGGGGRQNGIGRATALLFAKLGANVAILDINEEAAAETAGLIKEATGTTASVWQVDVTKEEQIAQVVEAVLARYQQINVWAQIVGGHQGATLIEEIPPAIWRANLELNLTAAFLCTRAVLPVMKRQRQGKIVLASSMAARIVSTPSADYAAAKMGIVSFTRQLAFEAGPFNINANAISPGPTHEPDPERDAQDGRIKRVPLRRLATPEDQAKAITFLASRWADMITGITLDVDGGQYLGWMDYDTYLAKHRQPA